MKSKPREGGVDGDGSVVVKRARKSRATVKPVKDTLVAILKAPRDLTIVRQELWYRIPTGPAPNMVKDGTLRYLAFYQPSCFRDRAFRVEYYARVTGISIVKRVELLPAEPAPKRAMDEYYKLEFPQVRQLPEPIVSRKKRRLIFITTTFEKFLRAREIKDLFMESPIEERLWTALLHKNITPERQYWVQLDNMNLCLDFAIFAKQRCIDIECDGDTFHMEPQDVKKDKQRDNLLTSHGWSILRYTTGDIMNSLGHCTQQIQETIACYGGSDSGLATD